MNLPKTYRIGHLDFKTEFVNNPRDNGVPFWGRHSASRQTMTLDADLKAMPQRLKEVVLHELLHGLMDSYHPEAKTLDKEAEEKMVSALSVGLATFIRDNRKMMEFLCA